MPSTLQQWGVRATLACALAMTCAAAPSGPTAPLNLYLMVPDIGYVGTQSFISGDPFNPDPETVHQDVTLDVTLTGSFNPDYIAFWGDPTWACSLDAGTPGVAVVLCHADELQYKNGFEMGLTPTAEGTITAFAQLTEGGALVMEDHRFMSVVSATSADLGVYAYKGGDLLLGEIAYVPVVAYNDGPLAATGVTLDATLAGPGRIVSVSGWGKDGSSIGCPFTDTTVNCALGELDARDSDWLDVLIEGTAAGEITLTANAAGNEPDPNLDNNTAVATIAVVEPKIADLAVTMTDAPDPILFKKPLTYTIVVDNFGPDTAYAAMLDDWLPYGVTVRTAQATQGSCAAYDWGYVTCYLGELAAGASATVEIVVTPTQGGTVENVASASNMAWPAIDPDFANNTAYATTTVRGPTPPIVTTSTESKFPFQMFAYIPCVDDYVIFEGTLHESYHVAYNTSGGWARYEVLDNPQGLRGTAIGSGTGYQGTGMTRNAQSWTDGLPASIEYQNNFRLIGQGPGNDLVVHAVSHVTFGPDGTPTVIIDKAWSDCR